MSKVVYTDWRDRQNEPQIIGVYESDDDGYRARENKEDELKEDGFDTDEEVHVWIENVEILRDEVVSENDIELVMNALDNYLVTPEFAGKIEKILRKYL